MVAASLFVVMRNIADGIRLLLTAIVLTAVYTSFQPAANAEVITVASIVLLGVAMIVFTYFGGMEAVIWVEVMQLGIYIAGADRRRGNYRPAQSTADSARRWPTPRNLISFRSSTFPST